MTIRPFIFSASTCYVNFQRAGYLNVEKDSWENKDD